MAWAALLLGWACTGEQVEPAPEVGPLGLPMIEDGRLRAGAAAVDMTPEIHETFTDANGNFEFEGCFDVPSGEGCQDEGFDDVDGDGFFDARFIGGFGYRRPARDRREGDGIDARAVVFVQDGSYVALVSLDLVGLGHRRIDAAAALLEADGFSPDRLIVTSTHNHQGPDTMGLWGDPLAGISGYDPIYQDEVVASIVIAVRAAAAAVTPVTMTVGAQHMRDRGPYFNGSVFGGHNPTAKMHGMIHDIRDPVVVSDQVLALQGKDESGDVVFTLTSWSGHPEVRGGPNDLLSADWVGVTRRVIEAEYGGIAVHIPESLGGMQSALGGDVPLIEEDGTHVYQTCDEASVADADDAGCFGKTIGETRTFEDGLPVPVWAPHDSWAFVTSHGWHIAEAAIDVLAAGEQVTSAPIRVEVENGAVPVRNLAYNLLGPSGIFDFGLDQAITDTSLCPAADEVTLGCLPFRTFRLEIGPVGFITAPGELLPELAWGFPTDDPAWVTESASATARGAGARYFPQQDADCAAVDFADCDEVTELGDCDCLSMHMTPYSLGARQPALDKLNTRYKAAISMTSTNLSYIVPDGDVHPGVSLLSGREGDHYEDTVTPAYDFASAWQDAQDRIDSRW